MLLYFITQMNKEILFYLSKSKIQSKK